jgi:hypothetical protein
VESFPEVVENLVQESLSPEMGIKMTAKRSDFDD